MKTPVLLAIYKRPETAQLVFNEIRKAKPRQFFISADGPKAGEESKCLLTRKIVDQIDWDCEVHTLFQDRNLGGKWGGYTGINWFFENVEMGIILEDDDLPDPSFFPYCERLLLKYKEDFRIGVISGDNFQFGNNKVADSYYFSKYLHGWGWASWKRVWKLFDINMTDWPEIRNTNWIRDFVDDPREPAFWQMTLDRMYQGATDAWDYQFNYCLWKNKLLNILPSVNLISNIGFGKDSTHGGVNCMANVPRQEMMFPMKHPSCAERNKKADLYSLRYYL